MADNFNAPIIDEFRKNEGKVSGMFAGMELLLLTSSGAKSGNKFTTPLAYTKDGDSYIIIASKGGAPTNPDWFHNLKAHPEVTVEVGAEKFTARAKEATGAERDRLYAQHAQAYAVFNDYEAKTTRKIPVFVVERA
jgi:deazaflavin-dependent oxidoreductase (nitroreductase family)